MAMTPCPECLVPISEDADRCAHCRYPVAEKAALGLKPGGEEEEASEGGGFMIIVILALLGFGLWKGVQASDTQAAPQRSEAVELGEKLHWDLLEAVGADPTYRRGALVGAWTDEPRASITVPFEGWNALSASAQERLMRHAASLVPVMGADPFAYIAEVAEGEGAASLLRRAAKMESRDWCIYVGTPVAAEGNGGSMLRRGDEVASGASSRSRYR